MMLVAVVGHELGNDVNGDREDYGGVLLGRNAVQCLKIAQLDVINISCGSIFCLILR